MSDARPGDMREKVACRPRGEGVAGSWTGGGTASGGARQPNQWLGWLDAAKLLLLSSASASVLPSPRPKRAERAARQEQNLARRTPNSTCKWTSAKTAAATMPRLSRPSIVPRTAGRCGGEVGGCGGEAIRGRVGGGSGGGDGGESGGDGGCAGGEGEMGGNVGCSTIDGGGGVRCGGCVAQSMGVRSSKQVESASSSPSRV
mmetsp:Transcript_29106/g.93061  ORF Transcript_29106/g.93061 Transcript_29106/m.93061 type:complete len:202 (+) Transcript_29106:149-754(+)